MMHWLILGIGAIFLIVHYLVAENVILSTFGWLGIALGAVMWWRNEKAIISAIIDK